MSEFREDGWHSYPVRVYYGDTDAAGVVYYANYLDIAERGRTEMLRLAGIPHAAMVEKEGVYFAVRRAEIDYLRPAKLDDLLDVRSKLVHMGGASLEVRQEVRRDDACLVTLSVKLACVKSAGGPARIPSQVAERLRAFLT